MSDYIKQLEEQNEELRQSLADAQKSLALYDEVAALDLLIKQFNDSIQYRESFRKAMSKAIADYTKLSKNEANEVSDTVMYYIFSQGKV